MQTANTLPENLTYGIQLWALNCLYWDGHNYRFSRYHAAVDPAMRGRIAVPINQALKSRFAHPDALCDFLHAKGTTPLMPAPGPGADTLRALLPLHSSVYTVFMGETRTGSACRVLVLAIVKGEIVSIGATVGPLLHLPLAEEAAVIAVSRDDGPGAELVRRLAIALYQDAGALSHKLLS